MVGREAPVGCGADDVPTLQYHRRRPVSMSRCAKQWRFAVHIWRVNQLRRQQAARHRPGAPVQGKDVFAMRATRDERAGLSAAGTVELVGSRAPASTRWPRRAHLSLWPVGRRLIDCGRGGNSARWLSHACIKLTAKPSRMVDVSLSTRSGRSERVKNSLLNIALRLMIPWMTMSGPSTSAGVQRRATVSRGWRMPHYRAR